MKTLKDMQDEYAMIEVDSEQIGLPLDQYRESTFGPGILIENWNR